MCRLRRNRFSLDITVQISLLSQSTIEVQPALILKLNWYLCQMSTWFSELCSASWSRYRIQSGTKINILSISPWSNTPLMKIMHITLTDPNLLFLLYIEKFCILVITGTLFLFIKLFAFPVFWLVNQVSEVGFQLTIQKRSCQKILALGLPFKLILRTVHFYVLETLCGTNCVDIGLELQV